MNTIKKEFTKFKKLQVKSIIYLDSFLELAFQTTLLDHQFVFVQHLYKHDRKLIYQNPEKIKIINIQKI